MLARHPNACGARATILQSPACRPCEDKPAPHLAALRRAGSVAAAWRQHLWIQRRGRRRAAGRRRQHRLQVGGRQVGHGAAGAQAGAGDVRRQHHVGHGQQVRVHGRFSLEDVEPRRSDASIAQCRRQRSIVDDAAAGRVDDADALLALGEAVVVEGYMDVVGLYNSGVQNAVATMGTALTEDHCYELKSLAKQVVTVFDPDKAGQDAWHRSVHLFFQSKIFAKDLSLPDGLDPDEYVQKESAEAFYRLCETAPRQINKYLKEIAAQGPLNPTQIKKYLEEFTPILVATRNSNERALVWDDIAMVLNLTREALAETVEKATRNLKAEPAKPASPPQRSQQSRPTGKSPISNSLELEFLETSLRVPEVFLKMPLEDWQPTLRDPELVEWLGQLHQSSLEDFDVNAARIFQTVSDAKVMSHVSAGLIREGQKSNEIKPETYYELIIERLKTRKREDAIKALSAEIKMTQRLGKENEALELMKKLKELRTSI